MKAVSQQRAIIKTAVFLMLLILPIGIMAHVALADSWSPAGSMSTGHTDRHTATLLSDGRVLVTGGYSGGPPLDSAEIYYPATNSWSPAHLMITARTYHTATLLSDGRVLVTGGNSGYGYLDSAEIYNPVTNSWSAAPSMSTARYSHTATLLSDGRVLVTGGYSGGVGGYLASAEIYDPAANSWSAAPSMSTARYSHTATLLSDGRVLVTGGHSGYGYLASAEIYYPATNSWSATPSMSTARLFHTATLLSDGRVLVTGGNSGTGDLASAEIYYPAANSWSPAASMSIARSRHTATLLSDGRVLVTGGYSGGTIPAANAEIFSPRENQTITFGALSNKTFGDPPFAVSATASSGLLVSFSAGGSCSVLGNIVTLIQAGNCTIIASQSGNVSFNPAPNVSQSFSIFKATPVITWANPVNITYGTALSGTQLNATASVAGSFVYSPAAGTVLSVGNNQTLHVDFTPTDTANYNSASKNVTINVLKAAATLSLSNLVFTYDGTPKSATVTTSPSGLSGVAATYNGSSTPPTNAGSYAVVATLANTNYTAPDATGTLAINQATPTITWSNPADITYGTALSSTQLNATASVAGSFVYNPVAGTVLGAGNGQTLSVTFTPTDSANYNNASKNVLINVLKAAATLSLSNLVFTYDGTPKSATATTVPPGLTVSLTYDGSAAAPTNAGSYAVVGTVQDSNYQGSANGTLVIAKANQTITFGALANKTYGDADFAVSATASSGLAVNFTASVACTISGNIVHITGVGNCTITAHQGGNGNYNAAPDVSQTFHVSPTLISVANNGPVNEGSAVTVTASAIDPGPDTLTYLFDFDNNGGFEVSQASPSASHTFPDNGSYPVRVQVRDDNGGQSNVLTTTVVVNNVSPTVTTLTATPNPANEGQVVSFSGVFSDPGSDTHTILWNFGDGSTATGTLTPSHTYADNGSYTITLTVTDDDGGVGTKTLAVNVNNVPPTVTSLAALPNPAKEGQVVSFTGAFTDPSAVDTHTIIWNFGDGGAATGTLTPTHTYVDNGTYTVTLTITDDDRGIGTGTLVVTVKNVAPTISVSGNNTVDEGSPLTLNVGATDVGALDVVTLAASGLPAGASFSQTSGNPATGTLSWTPAYTQGGSYPGVTVTATDNDGGTTTKTLTLTVNEAGQPVIAVTNSNGRSISLIDAGTNQVAGTEAVGKKPVADSFFDIFFDSFGLPAKLYVAEKEVKHGDPDDDDDHHGKGHDDDDHSKGTVRVLVGPAAPSFETAFDFTTSTLIGVGNRPEGLAIKPDGSQLWVANRNDDSITVINRATETVIATVPLKVLEPSKGKGKPEEKEIGKKPAAIAFSPDGLYAYVAGRNSNNLIVLNATTRAILAYIEVGNKPVALAVSHDGSQLYVVNRNGNNVAVVDVSHPSAPLRLAQIPVGEEPEGIALLNDGSKLYVSSSETNSVWVYDVMTLWPYLSLRGAVPVGKEPGGIAVTKPGSFVDGEYVYVANREDNTVSVIDTTNDTVVALIPVGKGPKGVAAGVMPTK